jgi:flagella basal body P-ring formation protein FlgA
MNRKDCDNSGSVSRSRERCRPRMGGGVNSLRAAAGCFALGFVLLEGAASAGTIHVWPTAVVVEETIRLTDVADLRGFDEVDARWLLGSTVAASPSPGGSRILRIGDVREALARQGANLARITLHGASECAVSRPVADGGSHATNEVRTPNKDSVSATGTVNVAFRANREERTLREAIAAHFDAELAAHGGRAEITFDRTSGAVLELTAPPHEFNIGRRSGNALGLVSIEVEIRGGGRKLQTVPLVVQLALVRPTVVARRAINQSATLTAADVETTSMTFQRLEGAGFTEASRVIGQRAKRMIPQGAVIEGEVLETAPLVLRGQFVSLASTVGGIRVVSAGKAMKNGLLGDVVRVRAGDQRDVEFDAVVVGPGAVEVPSGTSAETSRVALGSESP